MQSLKLQVAIPTPATVTYVSTSTTGGALAAATTYMIRVTAIVAVGAGGPQPGTTNAGFFETTGGAEGAGQLTGAGNTNTITVSWAAVGAPTSQGGPTHYGIYAGTTGAEKLVGYQAAQANNTGTQTFTWTGLAPFTQTTTTVPAGNAALGNCFYRGGSVGALSPLTGQIGGQPLVAYPANTPFQVGRQVCVVNMTGGTITLTGSDDGITFSAAKVVNSLGVQTNSFATQTITDIILPNYLVASGAGLYILAAE